MYHDNINKKLTFCLHFVQILNIFPFNLFTSKFNQVFLNYYFKKMSEKNNYNFINFVRKLELFITCIIDKHHIGFVE